MHDLSQSKINKWKAKIHNEQNTDNLKVILELFLDELSIREDYKDTNNVFVVIEKHTRMFAGVFKNIELAQANVDMQHKILEQSYLTKHQKEINDPFPTPEWVIEEVEV